MRPYFSCFPEIFKTSQNTDLLLDFLVCFTIFYHMKGSWREGKLSQSLASMSFYYKSNQFFWKRKNTYRHTTAILWIWFQNTAIKRILQWCNSHKFFGFPVHIKVMLTLYTIVHKVCNSIMSKKINVRTLIKKRSGPLNNLGDWFQGPPHIPKSMDV